MHKLYELKDMLCEELEQYGSKDKLDVGGLEIVDKLAHAIKNIDKILENDEYSNYYPEGDMSYRGGSYARGRMNANRDSRGRYSSRRMNGYSRANAEMADELREMMEQAPNEQTRKEFQRLISTIEQM